MKQARRLIVKIGSSLLVDESSGHVRRTWLDSLCADIAACRARGQEVLIVSSGAVAVGRRQLGLKPPLRLEEKQAAAACGQIRLAHAYQEALAQHGITVAQVLRHTRQPGPVQAGHGAGIVLDREVDVSRGDWLLAATDSPEDADDFENPDSRVPASRELKATVAWLDDEPLVAGRVYWALHGHRWIKARIKRIVHRLDINTLAEEEATQLVANSIGHVDLTLQEAVATLPYSQSRVLGSLVLVDTASHKTAGAVLIN